MEKILLLAIAFLLTQAGACLAGWTTHEGDWNVTGSSAELTRATDTWSVAVTDGPGADATIECSIFWRPARPSVRAGIVFGYRDAQNYGVCALVREPYKAWNGPEEEDLYTIGIYQVVGGKEEYTNVCPWMYPRNGVHELKVVVAEGQILASLNGKPVLQGGILEPLRQGLAGVAAMGEPIRFTNVRSRPNPAGTKLYGVNSVRHDASGAVLPRWPHKEMVIRPAQYILWQAEHPVGNWLEDEGGKRWPPYALSCTVNLTGTVGNPSNYPPQEFSFHMNGLLAYYQFTGDKRALQRAEELAEWLLAPGHSTPADWVYPHISLTKVVLGKVVGDVDGKRIYLWPYGEVGEMKDAGEGMMVSLEEQGQVAIHVLRLYHLTGKKAYLDYVTRMADTLLKHQLPGGNWPYRVNPETGKPNNDFTANVVDNYWMLRELSAATGKAMYGEAADKAFAWLLPEPVRTNRWLGIFGDVPSNVDLSWVADYKGQDRENYAPFVAQLASRLLVERRDGHPEYVRMAEGLRSWIFERFMRKDSNGELGIAEQSVCYHVMPYHGFHQAMVESDLYEATGNADHRRMAMHFLNAGMYQTEVNGFIHLLGGGLVQARGDTWWCSITWAPTAYVYAMGTFPELAPKDENHLLRVASPLTKIAYSASGVRYATARGGQDRLVVRAKPASVTCDGKPLKQAPALKAGQAGWTYDNKTHLLKVTHPVGEIVITLPAAQ